MKFDVTGGNSARPVGGPDVSAVMREVALALVPGVVIYTLCFGWGVITNLLLATVLVLSFEALALALRRRSMVEGLSDNSALVSAWLFALALPPLSPWWLIAIGAGFAILLAKHVYGGLGYNPFNPAMVGYVVLLISFPLEMTRWVSPGVQDLSLAAAQDSLTLVLGIEPWLTAEWDAITRATPLDHMRTGLALGSGMPTVALFDGFPGTGWAWVASAWLAGGLWLIYRGIIRWHIPLALILSVLVAATVFHLIDPARYASPLLHLFSGATLLGAFFIATDPVTAPSSTRGRVYFAIGIGVLTYTLRTWGGYPDGIAFAVLLGNLCAPTIDYFVRPRGFGR